MTATYFAAFNVTLTAATPMSDWAEHANAVLATVTSAVDAHCIVEQANVSRPTAGVFTVGARYVAANDNEAVQIIHDALANLTSYPVDAIHVRRRGTTANLAAA